MPTMIYEVYDALKEAGASEEKAHKAAEAVVVFEHRFGTLEHRMIALEGKVMLLTWMVSTTNVVLTLGVLWKLLK